MRLQPLVTADQINPNRLILALVAAVSLTIGIKPTSHFNLPGVLVGNPLPRTVNLSLWTVAYELECYLVLIGLVDGVRHCHGWSAGG
jgi:hypothetical protein